MDSGQLHLGLCSREEVSLLRQYLHEYWASDHVLAVDHVLLDWQHFDEAQGKYNFVVAWSEDRPLPVGVLGFIPTARFDRSLADHNTLWLALWSVREDVAIGGLGIRLLNFMLNKYPHEAFGTIGISAATETLLRAYGCKAGVMNHHYMPSAQRKAFAIMTPPNSSPAPSERSGVSIFAMNREEVIKLHDQFSDRYLATRKPAKSAVYFANRYFSHPSFSYTVWALQRDRQVIGLMATRSVEANGSLALRIVDYLGPLDGLVGCYDALQNLLRVEDAEYIDLLNYGLPEEFMCRAGFLLKEPGGTTVVPDYFEPFEQRNVTKRFVFKAPASAQFTLFKADADQDRPNFPRH